ncbi:MAG TPA: extensin family protein [Xanthobacteraceae bacterium]
MAVIFLHSGSMAPEISRVKFAVVMALSMAALVGAAVGAAAQIGSQPATPARGRAAHPFSSTRTPPLVIPEQFAPPQEAYASFSEAGGAAPTPTPPSACQMRLAKIAVFQALGTLVGPGDCGAPDAVQLLAVMLPDQTKVAVTPPATLRCTMAEQVTEWVRDDVAPSLAHFGPPLRALDNFDSYECRGRNRVRAAALSEHGRADALDVRGFRLADGREFRLVDINVAKDWREKTRASACARFSTVLGPGSDGYHEAHIHLDLAERRNGYKLCQWEIREPSPAQAEAAAPSPDETDAAEISADEVPLPRPRPMAASLTNSRAAKKSESK